MLFLTTWRSHAVRWDYLRHHATQAAESNYDAPHDALTGLPNRTLFIERVEIALQRAKRCGDYLFAVLFRHRSVQDCHDSFRACGGDQLLITIAHLSEAMLAQQ